MSCMRADLALQPAVLCSFLPTSQPFPPRLLSDDCAVTSTVGLSAFAAPQLGSWSWTREIGDMVLETFRQDTPYHCRLYAILLCDFVLVLWVRLVISNLRPGKPRLLAAVPAMAATCVMPFCFSRDTEVVTTVAVAFLHVWVSAKTRELIVVRIRRC